MTIAFLSGYTARCRFLCRWHKSSQDFKPYSTFEHPLRFLFYRCRRFASIASIRVCLAQLLAFQPRRHRAAQRIANHQRFRAIQIFTRERAFFRAQFLDQHPAHHARQ